MSVKLNLLPQGLLVSKNLSGTLKTIRALSVILSVLFLVFVLGLGAFFIISKSSLGGVEKNVDQLKTEVLAQESSEQQLILLKDRLAKISSIQSKPSILKNIDNVNSLTVDLSTNSSISQIDAESTNTDLSMSIKSNDDLTKFMQNIENTNLFGSVILNSFGYSAEGYTIGVGFTAK